MCEQPAQLRGLCDDGGYGMSNSSYYWRWSIVKENIAPKKCEGSHDMNSHRQLYLAALDRKSDAHSELKREEDGDLRPESFH